MQQAARRTQHGYRARKSKAGALVLGLLLVLCIGTAAAASLLQPGSQASGVNTPVIEEQYMTDGQLAELQRQAQNVPELARVLEQYDQYPEGLVALYLRNEQTLDFLLGYPDGDKNPDKITLGEEDTGLLLQWDTRWGYAQYGDGYFALTGCGPTCLSMAAVQLTGEKTQSPLYIARLSEKNDYYTAGVGTSWKLMTKGAEKLGLESEELPLSQSSIEAYLSAGLPVILSVKPGDFTTTGHFILLAGMAEDGGYIVRDPNSMENSARIWQYTELEGQISNIWGYSI